MQYICQNAWCQQPFTLSDREWEVIREMSPVIGGKEFVLPPPVHCHDCALLMMTATRNERQLYRRECDATKQTIVSAYAPTAPFTVYENTVWWGDGWDPLSFGMPFVPSQSFTDQFRNLLYRVPREGTSIFRCQNCDFNSHTRDSKDCYMNALVSFCEDTYYSYWMVADQNVFDCAYMHRSTRCFECRDSDTLYECVGLEESSNCTECLFGYELHGCKYCILCSNLVNKEYMIENRPCTREEFDARKAQMLSGSWNALAQSQQQMAQHKRETIHRANHTLGSERVVGDHLVQSHDCVQCFDGDRNEQCFHAISLSEDVKTVRSYSAGWPGCELIYHSAVNRGSQRIIGCRYTWYSNDLLYCDSCSSCKNCIGCIALKHKEYCILNVQYTKQEYERLAQQVIERMQQDGLWGQPLPNALSAFGYNETVAMEYRNLSKEEALACGYRWSDYIQPPPQVVRSIPAIELPDSIDDIPDDILSWAIECEATKRPFKIIKQELEFYRTMKLPVPRFHPDERHRRRMALRNPRKLWDRECAKCRKPIATSFAPERPESVYCEGCYLKEVY